MPKGGGPGRVANLTRAGMGRPKGSPDKRTVAQREWAQAVLESEEYRASALRRILAGRASHLETLFHEATVLPRTATLDVQHSGGLSIRWAVDSDEVP